MKRGRLVVGFTGGDLSLDALALTGAVGRAIGKGIVAVEAVEKEGRFAPYDFVLQSGRRSERRDLQAQLDEAAPRLAPGVHVELIQAGGLGVPATLHDIAEEEGAPMLVVGPTHRNPVGAALLGATADSLVHGSSCGVAVAARGLRDRGPLELANLGVALDDSDEAPGALAAAADLAKAAGARLAALNVVPRSRGLRQLDAAREWLERVAAEVAVGIEPVVLDGDPGHLLAEQAAKLDLLVVGSCGRARLQRALSGSVSSELVRNGRASLLVVPRGGALVPALA